MLYDKLRETPFFQGLTSDNLMQIIGQTKFCFRRFSKNEVIKKEGEKCERLAILLSGEAKSIAYADDYGYSVEEAVKAPFMFQPERFTGLAPHYTRTFVSVSSCDIVEIGQSDIMHISDEFVICRINFLNMVSAIAQKADSKLWHPVPANLRDRLVMFLKMHCLYPTGKKTIRIKMTRLAAELGTNRMQVSKTLNAMQDDGVLQFSRGIITVPQLECLR